MIKKNNWSTGAFGGAESASSIIDEKLLDVDIVILLQGTNLFGDGIYSYLRLPGRKLKEMFAKMRAKENFNPSDYGEVLSAGRGDPSQDVRNEMAATYNMIDVPMPKPAAKPPVFVQPKFFNDE